jgi:pimeloyl-ACP methyl ester carboxylesterase
MRGVRRWACGLAAAALVWAAAGCAANRTQPAEPEGLVTGSGSFLFAGSPGARDRPIRVWYHVPEGLDRDARVMFVMHGSGRTGRGYHEAWVPLAELYRFILFSPEFSRAFYPTNAHYRWGGMFATDDDPMDGEPVDESEWAFATVANLFDEVQRRFGITTPFYTIYGHSAGAQFVHRMLLFQPDPRIDVYLSANSGTYTMPSLDWDYPYGLDRGDPEWEGRVDALLAEAFRRRLVLLIGAADTATALSAPNMRPEAQAQGVHRFERAERFFGIARREAEQRGHPFRWSFRVVPETAHSNEGMAESALQALGW